MIQNAKNVVLDLLTFYEKKLSPAMIIFYEIALEKLDEDLLARGILQLKRQEQPNRFPTIGIIQKYYFEQKDLLWQERKRTEPGIDDLEKCQTTEHGKLALQLMRDLAEGRKTRVEYIAGMYKMDVNYPGLGWKEAANDLRVFWESEPERHAVGARYFERINADVEAKREETREKLKSQAEWLRKNAS